MGVMAENMKRFTEDLRATTKERKGDLRHIKKATEECLEGARGLIVQIGGRIARWPPSSVWPSPPIAKSL